MSQPSAQQTLQEHVNRAKELNVSLQDYAEAYDVDLLTLSEDMIKESPVNDFVKVDLKHLNPGAPHTVCSINHHEGLTIACHEWPPAHWLHSLEAAE